MGVKRLVRRILIKYKAHRNKFTTYNYDIPFELITNVGKGALINKDVSFESKDVTIGDYTYINGGHIYRSKIGRFCSIGYGVSIGPGEHYIERISTFPILSRALGCGDSGEFLTKGLTVIGNDVWIGNNAVILQGIKIGDGAVVAAGAVVTKNVPPYSIVGGIPAKVIRYRFDDQMIEKLLKLKWWNNDIKWCEERINFFHKDDFNIEDLDKLLTESGKMKREENNNANN